MIPQKPMIVGGQGGVVDLQVNGYGGTDFNDDHLSAEGLHTACERLHGWRGEIGMFTNPPPRIDCEAHDAADLFPREG